MSRGCHGNRLSQPVAAVLVAVSRIWQSGEGGSGIHQSNPRRKKERGKIITPLQFCPPTNISKLIPGDGADAMVQIEDMQIINAYTHTHDGIQKQTPTYAVKFMNTRTHTRQL